MKTFCVIFVEGGDLRPQAPPMFANAYFHFVLPGRGAFWRNPEGYPGHDDDEDGGDVGGKDEEAGVPTQPEHGGQTGKSTCHQMCNYQIQIGLNLGHFQKRRQGKEGNTVV